MLPELTLIITHVMKDSTFFYLSKRTTNFELKGSPIFNPSSCKKKKKLFKIK
jgi:hypothetical protein